MHAPIRRKRSQQLSIHTFVGLRKKTGDMRKVVGIIMENGNLTNLKTQ